MLIKGPAEEQKISKEEENTFILQVLFIASNGIENDFEVKKNYDTSLWKWLL